jgi:HPt (histidine-containing phosphotransfer) domain-containing protein
VGHDEALSTEGASRPSQALDASPPDEAAPVNWAQMFDYMDRNEALILEVMETWLAHNPITMGELEEAIAAQNTEDISSIAHTIKGAATTIAADAMSRAACRLEAAGQAQDMAAVARCYAELKTAKAAVETYLSQPNWQERAKHQAETVSAASGKADHMTPSSPDTPSGEPS